MASARSLHTFDRSKRWIEIIVQGCQLSIATKVLVTDLYAVQYAIPARKPKTQNKPQKQTSKPNQKNKQQKTSNKKKQQTKQKQNNQKNTKKWDRYQQWSMTWSMTSRDVKGWWVWRLIEYCDTTSRMFSTNLPRIELHHYDEWHVASPLPKGCSHRASNFHNKSRQQESPVPPAELAMVSTRSVRQKVFSMVDLFMFLWSVAVTSSNHLRVQKADASANNKSHQTQRNKKTRS